MFRAIALSLLVSAPLSLAQAPAEFEVASVKLNKSGTGNVSLNSSTGRFAATNVTLRNLITYAYDVRDHQLSGGPNWLNSERYDIAAKEPGGGHSLAKTLQMVQALLADRFQLKLIRETKELPVYTLVVGKNGSKLHEADG